MINFIRALFSACDFKQSPVEILTMWFCVLSIALIIAVIVFHNPQEACL